MHLQFLGTIFLAYKYLFLNQLYSMIVLLLFLPVLYRSEMHILPPGINFDCNIYESHQYP